MTYTFEKSWISEVTSHIIAYSIDIISLNLNDQLYTIELSESLDEEQYIHLNENYGLQEIN
jgi:hypothetical protein